MLTTGCNSVRSDITSTDTYTDTNGLVHVKTDKVSFKATTRGDAKEVVEKFRASNATKTQSIGISGMNQESSGTNVAQGIRAVGEAMGAGMAEFLKKSQGL